MRSPLNRNQSLFSKPDHPKRRKGKRRILGYLGRAFKRTCMVIGFFVLFSALIGTLTSSLFLQESKAPSLPDDTYLFLPLKDTFVEHQDMLGYALVDKVPAIRDVVGVIERAAADDRVRGLVVADRDQLHR